MFVYVHKCIHTKQHSLKTVTRSKIVKKTCLFTRNLPLQFQISHLRSILLLLENYMIEIACVFPLLSGFIMLAMVSVQQELMFTALQLKVLVIYCFQRNSALGIRETLLNVSGNSFIKQGNEPHDTLVSISSNFTFIFFVELQFQ